MNRASWSDLLLYDIREHSFHSLQADCRIHDGAVLGYNDALVGMKCKEKQRTKKSKCINTPSHLSTYHSCRAAVADDRAVAAQCRPTIEYKWDVSPSSQVVSIGYHRSSKLGHFGRFWSGALFPPRCGRCRACARLHPIRFNRMTWFVMAVKVQETVYGP